MRKNICLLALATLLMPALTMAQSVFDGTWKVDTQTAKFSEKPDVYLLQNGLYECDSCVPRLRVKADGRDQTVTGHPYFDTMSIKVVDSKTIEETDKKNGKVVARSKVSISPDGKTMTIEFSDASATNSDPVTGRARARRVTKGPSGSHAISGSWRMARIDSMSDNAVSFTFKSEGDRLTMSSPTGQGYTAKLDGTEAPYQGDPGITSASVKRMGTNTIVETDKRDGKLIAVARMTVSADGKTMTIMADDKLRGTHSEVTARKQ